MTWVDSDNIYLTRPSNLNLTLTKTVGAVSTIVTSTPTWVKTGNTWTYSYSYLPPYEGGVSVTYSVTETAPTNYAKTSTDLVTENRDFTNTLRRASILPQTSDESGFASWIGLLAVSAGIVLIVTGIILYVRRQRKMKQ